LRRDLPLKSVALCQAKKYQAMLSSISVVLPVPLLYLFLD
jgi:hypothetical protein